MSFFSKWGGKWLRVGYVEEKETWFKCAYSGYRIPDSEHSRTVITEVFIHSKTGKFKASRGYVKSYYRNELDPKYAIQEIIKLGGNIREDIKNEYKGDRRPTINASSLDAKTLKLLREDIGNHNFVLFSAQINDTQAELKVCTQRLDEITNSCVKCLDQQERVEKLERKVKRLLSQLNDDAHS